MEITTLNKFVIILQSVRFYIKEKDINFQEPLKWQLI